MPIRLSKIDDLTRPDHSFLAPADECFYLGEYSARKGYKFSPMNQLVFNLKKPMDRNGLPDWKYKATAIEQAALQLREALDAMNPKWLSIATLVPIPPSRVKTDPMYDDRLLRLLRILGREMISSLDIRELVLQRTSTEAAHSSETRPPIDRLVENYVLNEALCDPLPRVLGVVDDVLTTGAHFKAVQKVLHVRFPTVKVYGIFLCRRVPESADAVW